ncbi:MAG TPA: hypothetical protein PKE13_08825 [Hyphomicrobium zavarzinii]|jgi:hypothetical protein|nr:hypothetical protein [Hyphomicrobium zavarzinii]
MIRDEDIEAAVAQGIIDAAQARSLRDLARSRAQRAPEPAEPGADPDDEKFRLIGGFNDVFVSIGVLLLVGALFGLASQVGFPGGFAIVALVAAWGLSEFFSRRMRLALPSIVLALMFAGAGAFVGGTFGGGLFGGEPSLLFSGIGASLAAIVHERRFGVPIDWAIAASGVVCTLSAALSLAAPDWTRDNYGLLVAVLGLLVFVIAVRVDASDPMRRTRRSDIAFWLHMLAAPMIVHAAVPLIAGDMGNINGAQSLAVLAVFALLGIVALIIDRRALLISGLAYAGIAIGYLVSQNIAEDMGLSLTLLGLAVLVLGLSAGWRSLRRTLLPLLPLGPLVQYVPPTHVTDAR